VPRSAVKWAESTKRGASIQLSGGSCFYGAILHPWDDVMTRQGIESNKPGAAQGKPRVEHQFKKGTSGTTAGRPRRSASGAPGDRLRGATEPTRQMILEEAYRLVEMRDGDTVMQMPMNQALKLTIVRTNDEGEEGMITTATFEDQSGRTLLNSHEVYPSKEALEEAPQGSAAGLPEQLDELLSSTGR
jgi:hypothetical protein